MRVLTTQFKPTSGEASIFGLDVIGDTDVRKVISGYENLLIYAKIYGLQSGDRKKVIRDALEGTGMDTVADLQGEKGGIIRTILIEGTLEKDTEFNRVLVTITNKTRILE